MARAGLPRSVEKSRSAASMPCKRGHEPHAHAHLHVYELHLVLLCHKEMIYNAHTLRVSLDRFMISSCDLLR